MKPILNVSEEEEEEEETQEEQDSVCLSVLPFLCSN